MMKKIFILSFLFLGHSVSGQTDTLGIGSMPQKYYIENWPSDTNDFTYHMDNPNEPPRTIYLCSDMNFQIHNTMGRGFGFHEILYQFLNPSGGNDIQIHNFAAGKHTDNPIRIAGIAFFYPRYIWYQTGYIRIRDQWLAHGYDTLRLQLLDTTMAPIAEGITRVDDSIGKPVFVFNRYRQEIYPGWGGEYHLDHDIFEAYFDHPVTVTDSFYLAAQFIGAEGDKEGVAVAIPSIMEYFHTNGSYRPYRFPEFNWLAQGGYMYVYDTALHAQVKEYLPDNRWFNQEAWSDRRGFMLIFPILASDCGVLGNEITWTPMGGGNVNIRWTPGSWDSEWEVSLGPAGSLPGNDTVISTTSPSLVLRGIAFDTHYVAYVRSKCTVDDTVWSDWSDSVSIFIPSPAPQGIATVEAQASVELHPNPATEQVEVTSSLAMARIVVTDALGHSFFDRPATGFTATLDVSRWPAGAYLLQVHTDAGITTHKLLVQ